MAAGTWVWAQDIDSGPPKGAKVPELKVYSVSGPVQGDTVDYAAQRKEKPTVYLFIPADKWDRPMAMFIKELDKVMNKEIKDGLVVAVWLTDNQQKTKDYLPKVTQLFPNAAISYFPGDKEGPKDWFINNQADITVILANQGKVVGRFGYNSVNETVAREVMMALSKEVKKQ
jgi:hypothetical protein